MNIAVDIDDTLTDSFDYFLPFVAEFFGADEEELRRKNISYSTLPPEWKVREIDFFKAYYDKTAADTPFKPDAAASIKELRRLGHRIIIITGRTNEFYEDPYKTTKRELENGGIEYDRLICTLDKKAACLQEKIDVLIDDLEEHCLAAQKVGIRAIQFESKGNANSKPRLCRVRNWQEAIDRIKSFSE